MQQTPNEIYQGHEIWVEREMALGGWEQLFFAICRKHDGWFVEESFSTGEDTVDDFVKLMRGRVDNEIDEGGTYECHQVDGEWVPVDRTDWVQWVLDHDFERNSARELIEWLLGELERLRESARKERAYAEELVEAHEDARRHLREVVGNGDSLVSEAKAARQEVEMLRWRERGEEE